MKYLLIVKQTDPLPAEEAVWDHLDPEHTSVENIQSIHQWHNQVVTILSDSHDSTVTYALNMWLNEDRFSHPIPMGALLWWQRREEEAEEEEEMREENLGPVLNEDGTPSDLTKAMLGGTGRSLEPPFDFPDKPEDEPLEEDFENRNGLGEAY